VLSAAQLPDKYETNALQLPNSLKQRIAIARALLKAISLSLSLVVCLSEFVLVRLRLSARRIRVSFS
jgi:ABC-type antimicrobial peptide transport system ATPase subunit